jgi:hypothetical protein
VMVPANVPAGIVTLNFVPAVVGANAQRVTIAVK